MGSPRKENAFKADVDDHIACLVDLFVMLNYPAIDANNLASIN